MLVENNNTYSSLVVDANGTHTSLGDSASLTELLNHYEEEMTSYIYAIPHIPPTLFELKLRHADVKSSVLKMFDMCWSDANEATKTSLRARLDSQIDKLFTSVMVKNMNEYKVCQTGFIIGWKCSVNKPSNQDCRNKAVDDRF